MSAQKRNGGPKIASRRAEDPDVAALLEQLEAVRSCDSIIDRWKDNNQPDKGGASDTFSMEVTKDNFPRMLSSLRDSLDGALFVAIDCEMTGLFGPEHVASWWDTAEDRYRSQRASVEKFIANQIGISVWRWVEGGKEAPGAFEAMTYNFYAMPPEGRDGSDTRFFMCDPGSLRFLASNEFDFNKWIYKGISFAPLSRRRGLLMRMAQNSSEGDTPTLNEQASQWRDNKVQAIEAWLAGGEEDASTLEIEPMNAFMRRVMYSEITSIQDRQAALGADTVSLWWEKVEQPRGNWVGLVLQKMTAGEVQARKEEQKAASIAAVHNRMGLSAVMELLRDSGLPIIGHNVGLDLLFVISQFVTPLPPSWAEFQALAREWLPGGVFDTKLLSKDLPFAVFQGDTSLGNIHRALVEEDSPPAKQVDAYLRELVFGKGDKSPEGGGHASGDGKEGEEGGEKEALPVELPLKLPVVRHADEFDRYLDVKDAGKAHEAGYDAFMTGAAFCALLRIHEAKTAAQDGPIGAQKVAEMMHESPALESVHGMRNRFCPTGLDLAYWSLDGDSPFGTARSNVLVAFKEGSREEDMGVTASVVFDVVRRANAGRCKTEARWGGSAVYIEITDRDMQEEGKVREAMKTLLEALQKDDRTKELTLLHFTDWHAPEALLGEPPSKKQRVDADAE